MTVQDDPPSGDERAGPRDTGSPAPLPDDATRARRGSEVRRTAARFARASEILADCLEREPAERAAFVAAAAAGDAELEAHVIEMLRAAERSGTFLDGGLPDEQARQVAAALAGLGDREADRVAGYEIVEALGAGGFGTVWLARQLEPVRRDVALKVLKPGMDTRDIVARFEQERQSLARMSHENVARVLDAGVTDSGRPYFAMELVRGRPITRHCDAERLGVPARLRLFAEACRGVQHAHQRGIIHRDIKPSNVLVATDGGRAIPKVIDFGIAKAIAGDPEERAVRTLHHEVLGTPAYMSPEQATPGAVADTRTDVYSLGVLLYELLTGMLPFDENALERASPASSAKGPRRHEAPRPSERLRTGQRLDDVARARGAEPAALRRELRGDLDWIVMTAMAGEPERRYPSVEALMADVERHLEHVPIEARPPSAVYRLRKLARRHRYAVAAATVALALLVAGLLGTTYGLAAATEARHVAEERSARAEEQAYRGSMLLAEQAIRSRRLGAARALLEDAPQHLRGWEWSLLAGRLDRRVAVVVPRGSTIDALLVAGDGLRAWSWDRRRLQSWDEEGRETAQGIEVADMGLVYWGLWEEDGGAVLSLDQDGRLFRTDASRVAELPPLPGRPACACYDAARGIAYWSDEAGTTIASRAAAGGAVHRGRLALQGQRVIACGITGDGARLFLSGRESLVIVDAASLAVAQEVTWPASREIAQLTLSPDGSTIAVGWADGTVELRAFGAGGLPLIRALPGFTSWISSLAWSSDGRRVAAGCGDGSTSTWDAESGELLDTLALSGDPVGHLAFLGRHLLIAPWDGGLVRWRPGEDQHRRLRGHASYAYAVSVLEGGALAVSGGWDVLAGASGGLKLWDLRSRELIASWGDDRMIFQDVEPMPGGARVLAAVQAYPVGLVSVLDVRTGELTASFDLPLGIVEVAALDERTAIAVEGGDGAAGAYLLDVEEGTTREMPDPGLSSGYLESDRAVAVSPDGRWLAMSWGRGGIQLRDARTLAVIARELAHDAAAWSLAFSPDGALLASASDDGTVALWDVPTLRLKQRLRGSGSPAMCAAWRPDGSRVAAGTRDGGIELWDPARALLVGRLTGHRSYVKSVTWTPDGQALLSASGDHEVRVWDSASSDDVAAIAVQRHELLGRLEPVVESRLAATGAAAVATWIDAEPGMSPREREIARQVLLRRSLEGQIAR